jgi:hypothetical protein
MQVATLLGYLFIYFFKVLLILFDHPNYSALSQSITIKELLINLKASFRNLE